MIMLLAFCATCCLIIYTLQKPRKRTYIKPPELSGGLPIIGHAHWFIGDAVALLEVVKKLSSECLEKGGVVSYMLGPQQCYAITDPEDCATVANKCLQKDILYDFVKPWLGNGLLTADVSTWRIHRKMINPAFSQNYLNSYIPIFNEQSRYLVKKLAVEDGKGLFDHGHYLAVSNLETICQTGFGIDAKQYPVLIENYVSAAHKMMGIMMERFQKVWLYWSVIYNLSTLKKEHDRLLADLKKLPYVLTQERKYYLANKNKMTQSSEEYKPFLDIILEMEDDSGIYNKDDLRDDVDTFVFGGHDTTATIMTFALTLIGSNQSIQEKLLKEIQNVMGNSDRDVTKEDIPKLVYTEAVLKETMRLYPIGPVLSRFATEDVKLKNYTVPAGTTCNLFIWGLHRHIVWGADPDTFKPERWLDPTTLLENPYAFAGFSLGRRGCIGKVYGMMTMKTTLVHLLRKYRLKADITDMKIKFDIFIKPVSGHYVSIEHRQ